MVMRPANDGDVPRTGRFRELLRCGVVLVSREGRDQLLPEAVEVFDLHLGRGAERGWVNDAVEAEIALLDRLQGLDDVFRRLARKPPAFAAASIVGNLISLAE